MICCWRKVFGGIFHFPFTLWAENCKNTDADVLKPHEFCTFMSLPSIHPDKPPKHNVAATEQFSGCYTPMFATIANPLQLYHFPRAKILAFNFDLNIFYSEEMDWAWHWMRQCTLQDTHTNTHTHTHRRIFAKTFSSMVKSNCNE